MSSIRATWQQHKASTIYLTLVILGSFAAILAGLPGLSLNFTTTGLICAVALVLVEGMLSRDPVVAPEPALVVPGQDAFLLANFLTRGDGTEATNLIYGSDYAAPVRLAQLLEQTVVVLRITK